MNKTNKTKTYIEEALLKLLKNKNINDITVSEIVQTAGVARASFYRNYLDIDEVINSCFSKTFEDIFLGIKKEDIQESVYIIFREIKKRKDFFITMKKQGLLYKINDLIYHRTLLDINKLNVFNNKYQPYFFAGASAFLIQAWIDNDFLEDEKTMADIFFKSLKGYMDI